MAAALLALAGPACAGDVVYDYAGAFTDGTDLTGVFGTPLRDLAGVAFTARFRRGAPPPGALDRDDGVESFIQGSGPAQPVWASITIDGATWTFAPGFGMQDQQEQRDACGPGCDFEAFQHRVESQVDGFDPTGTLLQHDASVLDISSFGFGTNFLADEDYHSLGPLAPGDVPFFMGDLRIEAFVFDTSRLRNIVDSQAFGHMALSSLTVSLDEGAAPEPGTWALMVGGFSLAGTALRRRQRLARA